MLHWRLILAAIAISLVLGLAWLDQFGPRPGIFMLPLALVGAWMCAGELMGLNEKAAAQRMGGSVKEAKQDRTKSIPWRPLVYMATMLTVLASTAPMTLYYPDGGVSGRTGWIAWGLISGLLLALIYEMATYDGPDQPPGTIATRLARTMFAISYAGGLMGFLVQLRIISGGVWMQPDGTDDCRWGMLALLTTIATVKMNDTGAYFAGHAFGRHKMTPKLSPGKTWEGTIGGFIGSIAGAMFFLGPVAHWLGCEHEQTSTQWMTGVVIYALIVGLAGVLGDLAISLLKRDAGVKDSSTWMPGFGGFLDLLDSILLAAPVSYALWMGHVVGP
ncbi:phosphatidate cytidylyltransferase [Aeoliella sp. ICT_H6.2]|uniref:Phosphatidate cytidylyltransferase n=1 Tax=Aeoliella straminimaris TaxID=2954799 RepID=A0A9X2F670_9BACT|nr:phosphatidate cytidylyltransferase [Aeoliella straminimaris]MCO6042367.1 phosphatidate cytidylyltransferase [Aeoliella straminimaris]